MTADQQTIKVRCGCVHKDLDESLKFDSIKTLGERIGQVPKRVDVSNHYQSASDIFANLEVPNCEMLRPK